jgi:AdoMet-dependent rRNA methyltransferase SPB1
VCLPCLVPGDATNDLIKRGVGKNGIVKTLKSTGAGFEIVPAEVESSGVLSGMPARVDSRTYDSDEENYDTHDRTRTLALGTMMLRHSKKKALVDASYNRFAWNDPSNMPSWFLDDEMRHNKPQLPIPNALLEQIKSRFQKTGTKEIKKVAEARMRKRKRATLKLKAAKKAANVMAESNEVSERQKLKVRLCCLISFFLRFSFFSFLFVVIRACV